MYRALWRHSPIDCSACPTFSARAAAASPNRKGCPASLSVVRAGCPRDGDGPQPALYFDLDQPLVGSVSAGTQTGTLPAQAEANDLFFACWRGNNNEASPRGPWFESRRPIQ